MSIDSTIGFLSMAQLTSGMRAVLSCPRVYDIFQRSVGGSKLRKIYVNDFVRPQSHDRILDIGCGTSEIINYLPKTCSYVGVDVSVQYITAARKRYKGRGEWHCSCVNRTTADQLGTYDIVMANGLLHHLGDREASELCRISAKVLKPGGRLCAYDGCFVTDQSPLARYIIERDRGQNIRRPEEYLALLQPWFKEVQLSVRHNLLNIPYTHAIMIGKKGE